MHFWYDKEPGDQNHVNIIAIRCSNFGKDIGLSMNNINTNYKDIIASFLLNTLLHHVGMSWIIEINEKLKYDIYKHNKDRITGGHWYNKYACKKLYGTVIVGFIRNTITDRYDIMCYIDAHEKEHP